MAQYKIISSYAFQKPLSKIWKIMKNTKITNQLPFTFENKKFQEPIFLTGDNSFEKNATFLYHFIKEEELYYQVEEVYETDYTAYIKWKVSKRDIYNPVFFQTIMISYLSDKSCYLTCQYEFNKNSLELIKDRIIASEKKRQKYYLNLEIGISTRKYKLTHYDGIKINASYAFAKQFLEIPQIIFGIKGKLIRTTNKESKKGTIVIAKVDANLNLKNNCIIKEYELNAVISKVYYYKEVISVHFLISNNYTVMLPNRELIFQLYSLNENESYIVMRHNFFSELGKSQYDFVNNYKIKFLAKIKSLIEKMEAKRKVF